MAIVKTFGSGGDYSTLAAAYASITSTAGIDVVLEQVGNTTETSYFSATGIVQFGGAKLTIRNQGNYKITLAPLAPTNYYETTPYWCFYDYNSNYINNASDLIIDGLNIDCTHSNCYNLQSNWCLMQFGPPSLFSKITVKRTKIDFATSTRNSFIFFFYYTTSSLQFDIYDCLFIAPYIWGAYPSDTIGQGKGHLENITGIVTKYVGINANVAWLCKGYNCYFWNFSSVGYIMDNLYNNPIGTYDQYYNGRPIASSGIIAAASADTLNINHPVNVFYTLDNTSEYYLTPIYSSGNALIAGASGTLFPTSTYDHTHYYNGVTIDANKKIIGCMGINLNLPPPTTVSASKGTESNKITVSWNAADPQPDAYEIFRTTDGPELPWFNNLDPVAIVSGNLTSYVDTFDLDSSKRYYYRIKSKSNS